MRVRVRPHRHVRLRRARQEDIALGRRFVWSVSHPMYNPFNRIVFPAINVGNPLTAATRNSNGNMTGGSGFVNVNNIVTGSARNMLVVARIAF